MLRVAKVSQIELKEMFVCQSPPWLGIETFHEGPVFAAELVEDVASVLIARRPGKPAVAYGVYFERRQFGGTDFFIREDVDLCGVIDGDQFHPVEICRLPQFF